MWSNKKHLLLIVVGVWTSQLVTRHGAIVNHYNQLQSIQLFGCGTGTQSPAPDIYSFGFKCKTNHCIICATHLSYKIYL